MTFLPVAERELRLAARWAGTHWIRLGFALGTLALWATWPAIAVGATHQGAWARLFHLSAGVLGVVCPLVGVLLTADCLSREEREGTLGLLLLANLKGGDIVWGKLVAHGGHIFWGMCAAIPILELPLLAGGVSGGEFARVALALVLGVLFSLAVGMAVSTATGDRRAALVGGFLLLDGYLMTPQLFEGADKGIAGMAYGWVLLKALVLWPSPLYCLSEALPRTGPNEFRESAATLLILSVALLSLAARLLPRKCARAESGLRTEGWWARRQRRLRYGDGSWRHSWRREALAVNPALWLGARDRAFSQRLERGLWVFLALMTLGLLSAVSETEVPGIVRMCPLFLWLMGLLVKVVAGMDAASQFGEPGRTGATELLDTTPLRFPERAVGLRLGLAKRYRNPVRQILAGCALCHVAMLAHAGRVGFPEDDLAPYLTVVWGIGLTAWMDTRTLVWMGLRAGRLGAGCVSAALSSLVKLMAFRAVVTVGVGILFANLAGLGSALGGGSPQALAVVCTGLWFAAMIGASGLLGVWARDDLTRPELTFYIERRAERRDTTA